MQPPLQSPRAFAKIPEQLYVMTLVKSVDFSKRAACMSQMLRVLATSVGQSSVRQTTPGKRGLSNMGRLTANSVAADALQA